MRKLCSGLWILAFVAALGVADVGIAGDSVVRLRAKDGREVSVAVPGGPGSSAAGWGAQSTIVEVLQAQGVPDSVVLGAGGQIRGFKYRDGCAHFGESGRVEGWCSTKGLAVRRAGGVAWRDGRYFGTAADAFDLLGQPTRIAAAPVLLWMYGSSRIAIDLAGNVSGVSNDGELAWGPGGGGYVLRGLNSRPAADASGAAAPAASVSGSSGTGLSNVLNALFGDDGSKSPEELARRTQEQNERFAKQMREQQAWFDELMRRQRAMLPGTLQSPLLPTLSAPLPPAPAPARPVAAARRKTVELYVASGRFGISSDAPEPCYLQRDTGPFLKAAMERAGFLVTVHYYCDEDSDYPRLLSDVRGAGAVSDRVVLVGHSHGGVWTHAAARDAKNIRIDALIDLDATSYGWQFKMSPSIGEPRNAYTDTRTGARLDLEDVVPANVVANLEVRSGEFALRGWSSELYDEQPNVALSSKTTIETWNVGTSHTEVHQASGTTLPRVAQWLVRHL
jgi:hypothetical protein